LPFHRVSYQLAKHFDLISEDTGLQCARNAERIAAEAALDGAKRSRVVRDLLGAGTSGAAGDPHALSAPR
jgi:hypothetical protein